MNTQNDTTVWRIYAGTSGEADDLFLKNNVIALGWASMPDLRKIRADREAFKETLAKAYPNEKPRSIQVNAGQLFRFLHEMKTGDLVVYPSKRERQINIGIIQGDYQHAQEFNPTFPHRRPVKWIKSRARDFFSSQALHEIGAVLALMKVDRNSSEFILALDDNPPTEFERLFASFVTEFAEAPNGQKHLDEYYKACETGVQNYQLILTADQKGEDITHLVLRKLLPHADKKNNREAGAWVHIAPAITGDIQFWFERKGWTAHEDWPRVARAILELVRKCNEDPNNLEAACKEFVSLPYTRGLQTGMITPILNALNPNEFSIINNKPRRVINYFTKSSFPQSLASYPELNIAIKKFVNENKFIQEKASELGVSPNHLFDMFSHWLVAIKRYFQDEVLEPDTEEDEISTGKLVEPFSRIFRSYDEAYWALDVLQETLIRAGFTNPEDERFAITISGGGNRRLRIILGNWVLMSFIGRASETLMQVTLTTESAKSLPYDSFEPFARDTDDPECRLYRRIPVEDFKSNEKLITAYQESMPLIGELFAHWRRGVQRGIHVREIGEAIFDPAKREALLSHGLQVEALVDEEPIDPIVECSKHTGFTESEVNRWLQAISRKRQAIIYGPPGTGKTFVAQELAKVLTAGNDGLIEIVQFHPAYSYEDFIQGIRPRTRPDGTLSYEMTRGRFLSFCDEAVTRSDTCVMIIDEINRANLSRVFGELMYLMEYRDKAITLAGGEEFSIPDNVRIIGTMNTADRSIALVDHALRRRFAFLELFPNFEILRQYHQKTGCQVDGLIQVLERLNKNVNNPNYSLGISYFMREDLPAHLEDIWKTEIEPYLNEYFFDKPQQAALFAWDRIKAEMTL